MKTHFEDKHDERKVPILRGTDVSGVVHLVLAIAAIAVAVWFIAGSIIQSW